MGDVLGIVDGSGNIIVSYRYNAWGLLIDPWDSNTTTANALAENNSLLYRGYCYDSDLGMYYLQSRFYDPTLCRFVNADGVICSVPNFNGTNLYTYCNNNPVNYTDLSGDFPVLAIAVIVIGCLAVGVDHYLAANYPDGRAAEVKNNGDSVITKKAYAEGHGFECSKNGITLCDLDLGVTSATYTEERTQIGFFDTFTASVTAELDWSGTLPAMDLSAVAAIYTADIEHRMTLFCYDVTFTAAIHIGAIGGGIEFDVDDAKFKFTSPGAGVIFTGGFDIDYIP